jgi:hypothetical protein
MGSVCAYLERDRQKELPTYAYLPCPLGWGEVRRKAGPHGGFLGRRYDAFSTECTAYVDNPPDDIWKPQVVRGEPQLRDAQLLEGITLDRLQDRRRLVEAFDDQFRGVEAARDLGNFPREQRLAFEMLTSAKVREAFDISREDARRSWPGGWSNAACGSSTSAGTTCPSASTSARRPGIPTSAIFR